MSKVKSLPLRLDPATYLRLRRQAHSEGRSMNELMVAALHEHLEAHPIPRERLRELAREIVAEDKELLEALARV
jgi:hypothetical protein